jgi:hypothetical protein
MVVANNSCFHEGAAQPCTIVYRTRHWLVHKSSVWGVDLSYFYLNRISQLLVHKPGEGFLRCMLAAALSPLVITRSNRERIQTVSCRI